MPTIFRRRFFMLMGMLRGQAASWVAGEVRNPPALLEGPIAPSRVPAARATCLTDAPDLLFFPPLAPSGTPDLPLFPIHQGAPRPTALPRPGFMPG
ncbi:MAG: hypothetical protein CMJ86_05805 [Planctomycetes bacterium]|nr:hypothetical protein [Planctomycetota bacterium]